MLHSFAFILLAALSMQNPGCTATGDLEIISFQSKTFPTNRSLRILLPGGYRLPSNSGRQYPVLYLNDGQNLFDVCTSLFGREEWRVDETVNRLIGEGKLPPMIVVGIDDAGRRLRAKEYLPYVDDTLNPPEPNPEGKLYPHFLLDEVVPFVESHYRVLKGPGYRVLGGSSYGAGIALYTVVTRQNSFGGLLLESPSIYADNYHLMKDAEGVTRWPQRIFIGTGTVNEPVEDAQRLKTFFEKKGFGKDRLRVRVQEGAAHAEKWWAQRLPEALEFLFSGQRQ
jgi:enterochelin esterase-like enzyme